MLTYVSVKGAPLNVAEFDGNTHDLDDRVTDLELNPPEAIGIDHFVVEGSLLTIFLTNGEQHGPFVLPTASWRWVGEWQPAITYLPGDITTVNGDVYFVRVMHVSEATFDQSLFVESGFVYIKILSRPRQRYDIGMFYIDIIGAGIEVLYLHVAAAAFTFYPEFANSKAYLRVATSTHAISIPIYLNEVTILGFIDFEPGVDLTASGGQYGTFRVLDEYLPLVIAVGDRLSLVQPYSDDTTAAGLAVTMAALTDAV